MDSKNKVIAWFSIIGAGVGASLTTSLNFFPEHTLIITSVSTLISAVVAFVVTNFKKDVSS